MAEDDWLIFATDGESHGQHDSQIDAQRQVGDSGSAEAARNGRGQRQWTLQQRKHAGLRMAGGRAKANFVKHCAKQTLAVEHFVKHVKRQRGWLQNLDIEIRKHKGDWHGISVRIRRLRSERRGRTITFSWRAMLELAHGKRHNITSLAKSYCTSRTTVRRLIEVVSYTELEWQAAQPQA